MRGLLAVCAFAALAAAAERPLYVFDDGLGAGVVPFERQAALASETGYAGVFYDGLKDIPGVLAAHKAHGMKLLGVYTGMNVSDPKPGYDPALPEAIRQLKGTGALIAFTVRGDAPCGDGIAVPVIREVADMAAQAGLKVALYPHYGFYLARPEEALRLREKVGRANVGVVFNLCHWLRSGDEANLHVRLRTALPYTLMVSINGADHTGDWDRLIQPLGRGDFDVRGFVRALDAMGYRGPVALQCYGIAGDPRANLAQSMAAWRTF
jgi:sugar phosphate isomerase/epimerase